MQDNMIADESPEYSEGFDSFWAGTLIEGNPYSETTLEHADWKAGWLAASEIDVEDDDA